MQVVDLGRQIDRVGKLVSEAEALAPARQSRTSAAHQAFGNTKRQATSLHRAITKGWTCACDKPHAFKLLISKARSHVLKVSFPLRSGSRTSQVDPASANDAWYTFDTTMVSPSGDHRSRFRSKSPGGESHISESGSVRSSLAPTTITEATTAVSSTSSGQALSLPKTHSHRNNSVSTITIPDGPVAIDDLCKSIQSHGKEACLGSLDDGQGAYHVFHANASFSFTSAEIFRVVSLGDILDRDGHQARELRQPGGPGQGPKAPQLSRHTRMSIALTLAYAVLELYPTPWLPESFGKMHVYFFQRRDGDIVAESPLLLCETLPGKNVYRPPPPPPPPAAAHETDHSGALLALGIMIMELWFGQTIESRPFWRDHCDDKGQEKEFTNLTAALEWQKKTKDEAGVTLHHITRRCIWGNFGVASVNLEDVNCVRAVYDEVVKPLEDFLGLFWSA